MPSIIFDNGETLTESVAILDWAAQQSPALRPANEEARTRLIEMLAFIASEIQKPLIFTFFIPGEEAIATIRDVVGGRYELLADRIGTGYLLGDGYTVADALLYVTLRWAKELGMTLPAGVDGYMARIETRPGVQQALREEGLA